MAGGTVFNGRLEIWQLTWEYFRARGWEQQAFGLGLGAARETLPLLTLQQGGDPAKMQLFATLHNDWGQILFELGWVGLAIAAAFYVKLFMNARPRNQAILAGFAVAMMGNPVLHFLPTVCILLAVIWQEMKC